MKTLKIQLEITARNGQSVPTKKLMQENIDAIKRILDGNGQTSIKDMTVLMSTITILEAIQKQLPNTHDPHF